MAWLSNTVHPCFTHVFRPRAASPTIPPPHAGIKEAGKKSFFANLQEIDRAAGRQAMGSPGRAIHDMRPLRAGFFYKLGASASEMPVKGPQELQPPGKDPDGAAAGGAQDPRAGAKTRW